MSRPTTQSLTWTPVAGFAGPDNSARRTGAALLASALGVLPLRQVFTDWAWLPDAWVGMLLTLGPAALLRMRWTARSVHLLPGLVLTVCYLTARFVPDHAWGGILPLHGAWSDISTMITSFGDTVRDGTAPLHSTPAVRLMLAVQLVLLAVVVDLMAVVARRPALAGVPLLLLFTLAGAVPRQSVSWLWFALAAAGYLLLLASDTRDELSRWGRLMPRNAGASRAAVKALSARRIGVIAVVVALAIPLVLPLRKGNLLADALHGGSGGGGDGGVSLDPFVKLKGDLVRPGKTQLLTVTTSGLGDHGPLYLREQVLDVFDQTGWEVSKPGPTEHLDATAFRTDPDAGASDESAFHYTATIKSEHLEDVAVPLFQAPVSVDGLPDNAAWSRRDGTLGAHVGKGDTYTENVAQPDPSQEQLQRSPSLGTDQAVQRWLQVPATIRPEVRRLVTQLTGGTDAPYQRTLDILDYFTLENGFTYSLSTQTGDTGDDLLDFLTETKTGFCQQYAASMAIMLRLARVPSRVVVGYTHSPPDRSGTFTVSSNDAHAWVEAYFAGTGWLPFDPTPLSGADAARSAVIPWAPKPDAAATSAPAPSKGDTQSRDAPQKSGLNNSAAAGGDTAASHSGLPGWATVLILALVGLMIVVVLLPAFIRWRRRRHRLRAASRGPDPLWQELADTAVDLGYVWSPVRSPRQVVTWLRREGVSGEAGGALQTLASAVEVSRYAGPQGELTGQPLVRDLRRVERSMRSRRTRWERVRARLLPDSLGWLRRRSARRH